MGDGNLVLVLVITEQPCLPQVLLLSSYSSLLSLHFHLYLKAKVSPTPNVLFNHQCIISHVITHCMFLVWRLRYEPSASEI